MPRTNSGRLTRIGLATVTAISVSLGVAAPAIAGVDDTIGITPRPGVTQEYADSTPALEWEIRDSFNNYTGGATHLFDGAELVDGTFLWPYKSTDSDAEGNTVVQYGGTVNYMKYCEGDEPVRGGCQLDLTVADPKIVFDAAEGTGTLYATVNSRVYLTGEWLGVEEVAFAKLDFKAGRYNNQTDTTTWKSVAGSLLEDGQKAFSNFYTSNPYISSLSFSYPGKTELSGSGDAGYSLAESIQLPVKAGYSERLYGLSDGSVLYVTNEYGTGKGVVVSHDLDTVSDTFEFVTTNATDTAFDSATNTLYWVEQKQDPATAVIRGATVSSSGLGASTEIATIEGSVSGFSRDSSDGTLGVLHLLPKPEDSVDDYPASFTTIASDGTTTTVELPDATALYPDVDPEQHYNEVYGSPYVFGATSGLRALNDGTYLYVYDHAVPRKDGSVPGALPVHITPANDGAKASLVEAFTPAIEDRSHSFRGVATDGTNIGIYNDYSNSNVAFLKYENGEFTMSYHAEEPEKLVSIAGMTFNSAGQALVASAKNYFMVVDPATGTVLQEASLSGNMKGTEKNLPLATVMVGNDVFIVDRREIEYVDYAGLQRLELPGAEGQYNPDIAVVNMGHTPDKPDSKSTADSVDAYFEDDTLEVTAGESVTSAGMVFDETTTTVREAAAAPEGTEFSLIGAPDGASIDAKTGAVTYAPSADTAAGETTISVKVSFKDGSDETVDLTVKVSAAAPTTTSSPAPTTTSSPAPTTTSSPAPTTTSTPAPTPDGSSGTGFLAGLFNGFHGISLLALASFGGILSLIVSLFHFFNLSIFRR
ncbi:HtaA domain-containing protein [Corynebacterium antarcticum]|uniref:HtaA domain-containing protein n=1 Tax=Corynebacterium antarcticum TaxID=2800405 RepID=UPI002260C168|nr:HtaA domain-containing protein [Corynebacterium antarcticum]MCX7539820.1 HtaA domain-containing protein [Corynebacterium antarcticum]